MLICPDGHLPVPNKWDLEYFRLVTAVHFDTGKVFALRFCSHAEYDREKWKDEL